MMDFENLIMNPWEKVYWFARMLINSDKYGSIGNDSQVMLKISGAISTLINSDNFKKEEENDQIEILLQLIKNILLENRRAGTNRYRSLEHLFDDLSKMLLTVRDFEVFALTCEKILVPINRALQEIPNDDDSFVRSVANSLLKTKGEKGLANIINILDEIGTRGCLTVERKEIVKGFGFLKEELKEFLSDEELNIVLTTFCQEFERRVAQKRKGRAGRGVEGITSIILDYFGIKATHAPEHFTTGLEVDKWIKTKDGWLIGISCKRTLRERWKQAYTTDIDLLNRHKIRELWHVLTYDKDLSDDKITEIGSHRAILYLPDESPKLKHALKHPGMKDYVRPMTRFIQDLKNLTH